MKKTFTTAVLAVCAFALPAIAQTTVPESINGTFRLTNEGFQEALTATASYELRGTVPSPANIGSVFNVTTDKMYSFANEMEKLNQMLEAGEITQMEYTQLFMNLMNVNSWKSGFYPLTSLTAQGQNYIDIFNKFPDYADAAIEYFLNNDAAKLYKDYRGMLTMLCVFASDIITPVDLETEETFRNWAERYLTRMRQVADFGLYLQPQYAVPDEADEETPAQLTGAYYMEFKTPIYVGSMEKAQIYINNMLTENGTLTDVDTLNIWDSAKHYMLQEMAREYPVGTPEYNFAEQILGPTIMNQIYMIGEGEDGGLSLLQLPDTFNSQGVIITADDVTRCAWKFEEVNEASPLAVMPAENVSDAEGWHYTTLNAPFAVRMLSAGMEAAYVSAVDAKTGKATLEKITGDVIPANTPVIIRNHSIATTDNKILPLEEEAEAIEGNVLGGVIFAEKNPMGSYAVIGASTEAPVFNEAPDMIPANSAYYHGDLAGVSQISTSSDKDRIFDLLGREVKNPAKGIYIVNGKKMVR